MKKIKLSRGYQTIVDDEDFDWLNQWKWYCNAQGYAVRELRLGNKKRKTMRMHRLINNTPDGFETDHIDRNTLNNRKDNLRTVTHEKNMFNLSRAKNNVSGYRGVNWHKETKKWRAYIQIKRKQIYLGLYSLLKDAISARAKGEKIYHEI